MPQWRVMPWQPWPNTKAPFSYQLALAHQLSQQAHTGNPNVPRPSLEGPSLEAQVQAYVRENGSGLPPQATIHPLTNISFRFSQRWLQPLIDFSIPPQQVYRTVAAWQLIDDPEMALLPLTTLENTLVMIAPGYYDAAGIRADGDDNFPQPPAIGYWRDRQNQSPAYFTGGEAHAYMTHHLLNNRMVVPIPDIWMILAAAVVGKALTLSLAQRPQPRHLLLIYLAAITAGYGVLTLQLYISAAVLLPWLLPSLTLWLYVCPTSRKGDLL